MAEEKTVGKTKPAFRAQNSNSPIPALEEEVLSFWDENKVFEKTLEKKAPDYVFYDGPPFATGTPHYGHIVASLMKDIVPRFFTMKGFRVERRWGWDCHGLPIENIVEKELGFKSKKDIEKIGIDKFNELCRSKVLSYVEDWKKTIKRFGRWVDMENDYKTMDLGFMESVWWVFKELWDKGLVYKDYRSMHICPRCETTLSQSEVAEGYRDVKDLSVIAEFPLIDEPGTSLLAWTTTPWTLIGNVALAVGNEINYVLIEKTFEDKAVRFILAKDRLKEIFPEEKYIIVEEMRGIKLVGKSYKPLFDTYANNENLENHKNGWKIYAGDFVTTEEGTGIVHIAPAFGEDDMRLGKKENLPFIQHVGMDGIIKEEVGEGLAGLHVKPIEDVTATDVAIIKYLAKKDLLFSKQKFEHSYPHCWRCDTPLLNYATSSWFVKVTEVKTKMLKQAEKINWQPDHIKDGRFGNWLEGARDWSISRQRFWASVIPIWECEASDCGNLKVIGSVKELEDLSGEKIVDIHKHVVDVITFKCEKCGGIMKRIPDVLDTWFDSGSMPYAQMHYPFENKGKFEDNFPAEFIAEGIDQTRAWFYYLHTIATSIKNSNAFKNVIVNGIVLAEDGKKMSKKLKNYPDPMEVINKYGADPLRYYLCSSSVVKANNLNFSEKDLAEQTRFFNVLLNVLTFYKMFSESLEVSDLEKNDLVNVLDKWVVSRLEETKSIITEKMEAYDLHAVREIPLFINDLSTWYVRRSRDRFKGEDQEDKMRALKTLRWTLLELAKISAPFIPFMAEHIFKSLGATTSVHLETWPKAKKGYLDKDVLEEMEAARKIVELGLAKRDEKGIKVRQVLSKIKVQGKRLGDEYIELLQDELNVKAVEFEDGVGLTVELDTELTPELMAEGLKRELTRAINNLRKEAGLTIQDKAVIHYKTTSKEIEGAIGKFVEEIKKDTLSDQILEGTETGKSVKINDEEIFLEIKIL